MAKKLSYYEKLLKQYEDEHKSQVKTARTNADKAIATAEADKLNAQRQAYISRMQQKKDIPDQLRQMGIVGGGSETTLLGADTNYQNRRSYNERSAGKRKSEIESGYSDNVATLTLDYNDRKRQTEAERQAAEVSTYRATLERFGSEKAINNEIKRLKAAGRDDLLPYAQLQRRAILDEQKSSSGSSGGSSGGSSSVSSVSSSGGSSTKTTTSSKSSRRKKGTGKSAGGMAGGGGGSWNGGKVKIKSNNSISKYLKKLLSFGKVEKKGKARRTKRSYGR